MSDAELSRAIPVLPARDLADSLSFYEQRLGFRPLFKYGAYAGVGRGQTEIHLSQESVPPISCRIAAVNVDALYKEICGESLQAAEPLETKPWGMRQFSVIDPTGNRITFAEPAGPAMAAGAARKLFLITFTHIDGAREKIKSEDIPRLIRAHQAWVEDVKQRAGSSLVYVTPAARGKTVRMADDGSISVFDGPFTGGPEAAGGFFIIEAESMDEAVEVAKRHRWLPGSNEVREIVTPPRLRAWLTGRSI